MKNNQKEFSPLITVAMPIYNAGEYLVEAVNSIVAQTYTNWELYVIDDGSTDNSIDSIKLIKDERIIILEDGLNIGLAARLNQAIDLAKGQYFARMDHDDVSYPKRFEKQVEVLGNTDIDLTCVRAVTISETDELVGYLPYEISHTEITAQPWRSFHMPHPTWMGRTAWFKLHRYSPDSPYCSEDQELLLRTYSVSNFACLPEILFAYRLRIKNQLTKLRKIRRTILKIQLKKFLETRQFLYLFLAIASYVINMLKDSLQAMLGVSYSPHKVAKVDILDATEYKKYKL